MDAEPLLTIQQPDQYNLSGVLNSHPYITATENNRSTNPTAVGLSSARKSSTLSGELSFAPIQTLWFDSANLAVMAVKMKNNSNPKTSRRRITLDDVAQKAGVSKWIASRSFTPGASVASHKRQMVLDAAQELGYQPSLLARALSKKQSTLAVIVLDDFANPHALLMLQKTTSALQAAGMQSILVNIASHNFHPVLETARQYQANIIILIGTQFDEQLISGLDEETLLIALARDSAEPGILSISCNDHLASQEIADHLFERGCRKPLYLSGPSTSNTMVSRYEGFNRRVKEQTGIDVPVLHCSLYEQSTASRVIEQYIKETSSDERVDAIFCENDILALGVIDTLKYKLGIQVPEEVAVVGFDNISLSANHAYSITTYEQPIDQIVMQTIEQMNKWLEHSDEVISVKLPGKIVIRQSS